MSDQQSQPGSPKVGGGDKKSSFMSGVVDRVSGKLGAVLDNFLSPGTPTSPIAQGIEPRGFDYRPFVNASYNPRKDEAVSFDQMRALANNCSVLAAVIQTRKDQMGKMKFSFRLKEDGKTTKADLKKKASEDKRIKELEEFFQSPDKEHTWAQWLGALQDDMHVIDAATVYPRKTVGGKLYSLNLIDGATINRIVDDLAMTPVPPAPAYQQILHGIPAKNLTTDELIYFPRVVRTYKLFGQSNVERIILTVNIALRREIYQAEYFTEGNMPDTLLRVPETWTPQQIQEYTDYWDTLITDTSERRKVRFVPNFEPIFAKPDVLKDVFDEWLARIICFEFSIPPQPFCKEVNRSQGETAKETSYEEGLQPIMLWVEALINKIIAKYFGYDDIIFTWEDDRTEDSFKQAQIDAILIANGIKSISKAQEEWGLDPTPDIPPALVNTLTGTFMPIEHLAEIADAAKEATIAGHAAATELANNPPDPNAPPPGKGAPNGKPNGKGAEKVAKAQKKTLKFDPAKNWHLKLVKEAHLTRFISGFLSKEGKRIAKKVAKLFKASGDDILDELNLDSWTKLVGTFEDDLSAVAVESSKRALAELDITDGDLFDLLQTEAMEWARDRAAEMVGMQYNDSGKLVPNPNARWAITDSTREGLRTLITNAYAEGIDVTQLAQQIQDSYLFSASRAMTIARTELAKADGESTLRSWKESGRVSGKQWLLGSEHDDNNPDECDDNADQGVIDLEDDFDSGDEAPPAHPNCVCAVITEILAEQGEVDDPGAE